MIGVKEAQKLILDSVKQSSCKSKYILDAVGQVLAEDIVADRDYPPFNRATMDGYALLSSGINDKKIFEFKIIAELLAGATFDKDVPSGSCVKIMTGAPLPDGTDSVIKVEEAITDGMFVRFSRNEVKCGHNVALKGEDATKDKVVIDKGYVCDPAAINIFASIGLNEIKVCSTPDVAVISTGDEIVPIDQKPLPYQIRGSNSYALRAFLKYYQIDLKFHTAVKDNKSDLKKAIKKGLESDLLILSGGVSMGDADFVPDVLTSLGVRKVFHKVKVKPGKPIWFGTGENGVVFGLPGNPMACQVGFKVFVEPYIRKYMQLNETKPLRLALKEERKQKTNRTEYFPCKIDNDKLVSLKNNGSGDITAAIGSNGLAVHPFDDLHLKKDSIIDFFPWKA